MKKIIYGLAAATMMTAIATPAMADTTVAIVQEGIAPGMAVVHDKTGDAVGTVAKVDGDMVFVSTDMHADVPLPATAFLAHEGKVLFGMTAADLNAAVTESKAAAAASVAVGKPVKGVAGNDVGVIEAMNDEAITIRMTNGKVVAVPVDGVQGQPTGAIALYEAAQLEAMGVEMTPEQVAEAEAARAAEKAEMAAEHAEHAAEAAGEAAEAASNAAEAAAEATNEGGAL